MVRKEIVTTVPDRLDTIVFQQYGATHGFVEAVLDANPGLADLGDIVPAGTTIVFPVVTVNESAAEVTRLWT